MTIAIAASVEGSKYGAGAGVCCEVNKQQQIYHHKAQAQHE
jgi:hypothetical protein